MQRKSHFAAQRTRHLRNFRNRLIAQRIAALSVV